jgi:hypothetical protein
MRAELLTFQSVPERSGGERKEKNDYGELRREVSRLERNSASAITSTLHFVSVKRGGRDNDVPYFTGTASGQPDGQLLLLLRYASFCSGNVRYANENSFPLPGSFGISLRVVRGVSGAVKDSFILLLLFAFYLTVLRPIASLKGGTMKCTYQFEGSWKPPLFYDDDEVLPEK